MRENEAERHTQLWGRYSQVRPWPGMIWVPRRSTILAYSTVLATEGEPGIWPRYLLTGFGQRTAMIGEKQKKSEEERTKVLHIGSQWSHVETSRHPHPAYPTRIQRWCSRRRSVYPPPSRWQGDRKELYDERLAGCRVPFIEGMSKFFLADSVYGVSEGLEPLMEW